MRRTTLVLALPGILLAQDTMKPIWVTHLPQDPGRVYAMGMAQIAPTEAMALKQASNQAKGEVLARLRATVKATTETKQTYREQRGTGQATTGTGTRTFDQSTQIQAQATDLPGLAVAQTWTDRKENMVYALAYLDVALAERDLRTRFDAIQEDLAGTDAKGDSRERLRKLQRLRAAQAETSKLDDMAGLLAAGGGDPALRAEVRKVKLWVDKLLDELRASLTFCIQGDRQVGLGGDVANLLRNAVLKAGLGWVDQGGEFTLKLDFKGARKGLDIGKKQWWDHKYSADFIVARGLVEVTLLDRSGTAYESTTLEAKGVGTSEFQADRNLMKEYQEKLGSTLERWLKELTK